MQNAHNYKMETVRAGYHKTFSGKMLHRGYLDSTRTCMEIQECLLWYIVHVNVCYLIFSGLSVDL